jgi:tripartite-type tricarboxylate transporter receptor subunit TctC
MTPPAVMRQHGACRLVAPARRPVTICAKEQLVLREVGMGRLVRLTAILTLCVVFAALTAPARAESFPDRPLRLLVAFPPGGAADFVGRLLAQFISPLLGQPVVVENRPGSNGNVAGDVVLHAAADGYTLLLSSGSLYTVNPHLYTKMPFDPYKELTPVASVVADELLLAENPSLPPKTFKEFIAYARAAKPPLLYGSIGNGSEHHLAMELLKERAGLDMTHVPYRGGGPAAIGVMRGEVAAMFGGGSTTPLVQSGKLRALAVSGVKHVPLFPDLPSISEFYPGYNVTIWQVVSVPAGTPPAIIARLRKAANEAIAQPGFAQKLQKAGAGEPDPTAPDELQARLRADDASYSQVLKKIGLRIE